MDSAPQARFDAVFIGAGHNALAGAIHLLSKGWSVGIFERSDHVGGCIATAEVTAPGFRHDLGAMNLSLFAGSAFHAAYGADLARCGLSFVPSADPFATAFPDGTWLGVSQDAEVTAARIATLSERDAEAWRAMTADFPAEAALIGGLLSTPMTRKAVAAFAWRVWRAKGAGSALDLLKFLMSSPRAFLDARFENPKLKAMMAVWGMHLDFAPSIAGGAVFPYLESMAGQAFGMVLGAGGADSLSVAMSALIAEKGGNATTGAEIARIDTKGNRATGVTLADGSRIIARKAVIAGVTPAALLRLTGETQSAGWNRDTAAFRHGPGTMMLHLALDGLPDWAAGTDLHRFAYVHLAPSMDALDLTYAQAVAGLLPAEPGLVVGQPTVVDPSRAPEGKHVLWIQVRVVPGRILGDAEGRIAATDWAQAAEPFTERVLDILDRYAPGIRDRILARHIVTPDALEAWNPNLVGGDQIAGSHHLSQNFLFRPLRGHADGSTPIRDLYLTGASVWPGAGVGAGSGYMLARRLAGR